MKEILITGGFGFLGSHLIDEIIEEQPHAHITVVDSLVNNAVNPTLFTRNKPIVWHDCDLQTFFKKSGYKRFDEIYHLASIVGPAGVLPHQGKIVLSIVGDAYAVANKALIDRAKLVFVSTSEVYGGGQDGYCSEDMQPIIPIETSARLEYAIGKLAAEIALINLSKMRALDVIIVRPFNIAGPRQQIAGGFVLPRFIKQAQDHRPLTVFGDGNQVRALTAAQDVAYGLLLAMERGISGEVYNIGNPGNKATINEIADLVIQISDSRSEVEHLDPKTIFGDTYVEANDKYPNSDKAINRLGWQPSQTLEDIIKSTVYWTRDKS